MERGALQVRAGCLNQGKLLTTTTRHFPFLVLNTNMVNFIMSGVFFEFPKMCNLHPLNFLFYFKNFSTLFYCMFLSLVTVLANIQLGSRIYCCSDQLCHVYGRDCRNTILSMLQIWHLCVFLINNKSTNCFGVYFFRTLNISKERI